LFNSGQSTESRGKSSEDESGEDVPHDNVTRSLPAQENGEFSGEEDNIEDGFTDIGVKITERMSPFIDILSKSLIRIRNSGINISQLIVGHAIEVFVVEIVSNALSEVNGKTLVEVVKITVDERRGDSTKGHGAEFLKEHAPISFNDGFDDTTLNGRDVYRKESSEDQEDSQEGEIIGFSDIPAWE